MKIEKPAMQEPSRALDDEPKQRACLRCKATFLSDGFGERICRRCKASSSWRNAAPASPGNSSRS
jgi:ribosomal protein L40E